MNRSLAGMRRLLEHTLSKKLLEKRHSNITYKLLPVKKFRRSGGVSRWGVIDVTVHELGAAEISLM
jgi:hypothetical protein